MAWLILCILGWAYMAIRLAIKIRFDVLPYMLDFDVKPMIIWLITMPLLIWLILITPFELFPFTFLFAAGHILGFWFTFYDLDLRLTAWIPVFALAGYLAAHGG